MFSENDIELMLACFSDGIRLLSEQQDLAAALGLINSNTPLKFNDQQVRAFVYAFPPSFRLSSPDLFFPLLLGGVAHHFDSSESITNKITRHLSIVDNAIAKNPSIINTFTNELSGTEYPKKFFNKIFAFFPPNLPLALKTKFSIESDKYIALEDASLVSAAKAKFNITAVNFLDIPTEQNLISTKINHAYWEFFLCAYAKSYKQCVAHGLLRGINPQHYQLRHSASSLNTALTRIIERTLARNTSDVSQHVKARLSISFSAGEHSCATMLAQPLTPIRRGAIAGALGFFSALNLKEPICLGDSFESKNLASNSQLNLFVEQQTLCAKAILFVVPPHLRNIEVIGDNTNIYRLIIPGSFANETWRVCLPMFLGMVERIIQKHGQVTVLTQSAMLAPLLGLTLAEIANLSGVSGNIRFFDLGRLLDVATPELVVLQPWFKPYKDKVNTYPFRTSNKNASNLLTPD